MRLVFLGTPNAAVPVLESLVASGHDVVKVVTRPDRKRGRGSTLVPSPVKLASARLGLDVAHSLKDLDEIDVERGVVVAYGALIPAHVLQRIPMCNVHFSLLPRWRGAAPVERAILAGDEETGVSIMVIEPSLDTGAVYATKTTTIGEKSAAELTMELATLGAHLLVDVLASPETLASPVAQTGVVTYADKLSKEDYHLHPSLSPTMIARTVRLGKAFCHVGGRRLRVLDGHALETMGKAGSLGFEGTDIVLYANDGAFALGQVQPEGSRVMSAHAWWSGARLDLSNTMWG